MWKLAVGNNSLLMALGSTVIDTLVVRSRVRTLCSLSSNWVFKFSLLSPEMKLSWDYGSSHNLPPLRNPVLTTQPELWRKQLHLRVSVYQKSWLSDPVFINFAGSRIPSRNLFRCYAKQLFVSQRYLILTMYKNLTLSNSSSELII